MPLLLRLRSGPVLTDAGELLVSHADAAICRLEQAERELGELNGLGTGELRMVSFSSASATVVAAAAAELRRRPSRRSGSASPRRSPRRRSTALKRGDFDVALAFDFELYPFEEDRDIDLHPRCSTSACTWRSRPTIRSPTARSSRSTSSPSEPWLCGSGETSCRQLTLRSCERAGFTPDVAYESNDYTVMLALVAAGMGVRWSPTWR